MRASVIARHTPLIRFIGKRVYPEDIDHTPRVHPQDPHSDLPASFKQYRLRAQQHGPLSTSAKRVVAKEGEVLSRNDLPAKYRYIYLEPSEIDLINSAGADQY